MELMKKIFLFIILFFTFITTTKALDIRLSTDKPTYLRYEIVSIYCDSKEASSLTPLSYRCTAQLFFKNKLIKTVGETFQITLRYNPTSKKWEGYWPIPWNPELGEYKAVVVLSHGNNKASSPVFFKITKREPPALPPGFCVMNIEPGESIIQHVPGMDGKTVKLWENYVLWANFMGASAMWHCVGQSQIWNNFDPENFPWAKQSLNQVSPIGAECHKYGIKYGAWITSFVMPGNRQDLSPYALTTGYNEADDTLKPMIYISIKDDKRIADITALVRKLNENPNVDYIGLDYMRTDFGGYEYVNEFVSEMPLPNLPVDWETLSKDAHMLWLGKKIQKEKDMKVTELWQWWRAHKMSQIIKSIITNAGVTKPMWVFNLTWKQGKQHGQDPLMFIDAGISMNGGMFYSIDKLGYPIMINEWRDYLVAGQTSLVVGQCVDWNLLGNTLVPSGPEEHYLRQKLAVDTLLPVNPSLGLFWHDLTRAFMVSTRGPFNELEWAITGAVSFSYLREKQNCFPFKVKWDLPDRVAQGEIFTVEIVVTNTSNKPMDYHIKLFNPSDIEMFGNIVNRLKLLPGEEKTINFQIRFNKREWNKENMTMIAFMLQCGSSQTQQKYFDFKYIKVEEASRLHHLVPAQVLQSNIIQENSFKITATAEGLSGQ